MSFWRHRCLFLFIKSFAELNTLWLFHHELTDSAFGQHVPSYKERGTAAVCEAVRQTGNLCRCLCNSCVTPRNKLDLTFCTFFCVCFPPNCKSSSSLWVSCSRTPQQSRPTKKPTILGLWVSGTARPPRCLEHRFFCQRARAFFCFHNELEIQVRKRGILMKQ